MSNFKKCRVFIKVSVDGIWQRPSWIQTKFRGHNVTNRTFFIVIKKNIVVNIFKFFISIYCFRESVKEITFFPPRTIPVCAWVAAQFFKIIFLLSIQVLHEFVEQSTISVKKKDNDTFSLLFWYYVRQKCSRHVIEFEASRYNSTLGISRRVSWMLAAVSVYFKLDLSLGRLNKLHGKWKRDNDPSKTYESQPVCKPAVRSLFYSSCVWVCIFFLPSEPLWHSRDAVCNGQRRNP